MATKAELIVEIEDKFSKNAKRFVKDTDKMSKQSKKFDKLMINGNKTAAKSGAASKKMAIGFGVMSAAALLGAKAITSLISSTAAEIDELNKLSQTYDMSVQSMAEWQFVAQLNKTSATQIGKAMSKLNMELAAGGKKFEEYGIQTKDASGNLLDQEQILFNTIDALHDTKNGTEKALKSTDLFGKGAAEMGAILNKTSAELRKEKNEARELAGVIDDKLIKSAENFNDEMLRMKTASKGLKFALMDTFGEDLTKLIKGLGIEIANIRKSAAASREITIEADKQGRAAFVITNEMSEQIGKKQKLIEAERKQNIETENGIKFFKEQYDLTTNQVLRVLEYAKQKKELGKYEAEIAEKKRKEEAAAAKAAADALAAAEALAKKKKAYDEAQKKRAEELARLAKEQASALKSMNNLSLDVVSSDAGDMVRKYISDISEVKKLYSELSAEGKKATDLGTIKYEVRRSFVDDLMTHMKSFSSESGMADEAVKLAGVVIKALKDNKIDLGDMIDIRKAESDMDTLAKKLIKKAQASKSNKEFLANDFTNMDEVQADTIRRIRAFQEEMEQAKVDGIEAGNAEETEKSIALRTHAFKMQLIDEETKRQKEAQKARFEAASENITLVRDSFAQMYGAINGYRKADLDAANISDEERAKRAKENARKELQQSMLLGIANTAVGVTKALAQGGVAGLITGGIVATAGGIQVATISKQLQSFSDGGVIGGSSTIGDKTMIAANAEEMVLNKTQQSKLWNQIQNGQSSGSGTTNIIVKDNYGVDNNALARMVVNGTYQAGRTNQPNRIL